MWAEEKAALAVGAVAIVALLFLSEPQARETPRPPVPPSKPPGDDATDDETALARMLASETSKRLAWAVIGWMALYTARTHGNSVFERLTNNKGYGPRVKEGVERYASTASKPTDESRAAARALLSGQLSPSARIRAFGHSSWVELLSGDENEAAALLRRQGGKSNWGGVWARLRGTQWYLLNRSAPIVDWKPGEARAALAKVPAIDPTDRAFS